MACRLLNSNALPVTASSRELFSPTLRGSGRWTTFTSQHRVSQGQRGHRGRREEESTWLPAGLFFIYLYPQARLPSVGSTLLHPQWAPAAKTGAGEGASKAAPVDTARHNMMRQPQSGFSAGQSFNRLNNSISTDH